MLIKGLQKTTLLDYPTKVASTVFTGGCNFRCPFCHNASLVTHLDTDNIFDEDEVLNYFKKRKGILDGVCITGGEPLLQKDIFEFCKKIKDIGLLIKLDTNGSRPKELDDLIQAELIDYIAMDIKNSPALYANTCGMAPFSILQPESAPIRQSHIRRFRYRSDGILSSYPASSASSPASQGRHAAHRPNAALPREYPPCADAF